jgi:extracellular factor (EF) 3-hydroxypalmitic acid methyl ester biosynthesis protein
MDNESSTESVSQAKTSEALVICENARKEKILGKLLRLARHEMSFEIHSAADVVQISEVMSNVTILVNDRPVYSGSAVVSGLINVGPTIVCQATLDDAWLNVDILGLAKDPLNLPGVFRNLIRDWQKIYKVSSEYKVVIADIQSFLFELCHWVDKIELGLSNAEGEQAVNEERIVVKQLVESITPALNHLFEKFEIASRNVEPELQPTYGLYAKRQLHALLLCSPFMHRIFRKPLGYAGDYEMVGMILRDPCEGKSLFAKILNAWFLSQTPAEAHRNRVKFLTQHLTQHLVQESLRTRTQNKPTRIFNLGCGPAQEVREFMRQSPLSDAAQFSLLDFNDETIAFTQSSLEEACRANHRATQLKLIKKSVGQVLKAGMRNIQPTYDVVYCAGLFDYLNDRICQQLLTIFYQMLAPNGLLIATNVDESNPIRNIMGYIFEWRLIERNTKSFLALTPENAVRDECKITADSTGCNIFLEIRKPM